MPDKTVQGPQCCAKESYVCKLEQKWKERREEDKVKEQALPVASSAAPDAVHMNTCCAGRSLLSALIDLACILPGPAVYSDSVLLSDHRHLFSNLYPYLTYNRLCCDAGVDCLQLQAPPTPALALEALCTR
jgi:hypothetical protein